MSTLTLVSRQTTRGSTAAKRRPRRTAAPPRRWPSSCGPGTRPSPIRPRAQEIVLARHPRPTSPQTGYGADHGAPGSRRPDAAAGGGPARTGAADLIAAYRRAFPVMTYDDYKPLIEAVMAGETRLLLSEEPVGWAITRGTVEGESKFIPMTPTDLRMRVSAGRAMMAYVAATKRLDLFAGVNLNLNFPSTVGTIRVGDRDLEYGYSSGIYTKHVSKFTPIRSVPAQDEIDALGGGTTRRDWDNRFELAIEKCRSENVTLVGGVCQTALEFGRYLRKRHGVYPKQRWKTQIMTLGSTPGINTRHAAALTAMYGPVAIREIYGATEGMFGQQRDDRKAWVPNYDLFFFEVQTRSGIKMLHEMKPGRDWAAWWCRPPSWPATASATPSWPCARPTSAASAGRATGGPAWTTTGGSSPA